jgi:hypothetical protein
MIGGTAAALVASSADLLLRPHDVCATALKGVRI